MLYKVAILGAGQLGSRHLQGLKKSSFSLDITVFDPSDASLVLSKKRFDEIKSDRKHKLSLTYKQEDLIGKTFDFVIIPTTASVRAKALKFCLENMICGNILLEKILFNRVQDYYYFQDIFRYKKINCYVNCSMRAQEFDRSMRDHFFGKEFFYHFSGADYGLMTNAIHMADHFCFLMGSNQFEVDTGALDAELCDSKRLGYSELNGSLRLYNRAKKAGAIISCTKDKGGAPPLLIVDGPTCRILYDFIKGESLISSVKENWKWMTKITKIKNQSELTNLYIDDLISKGSCCNLTAYDDSIEIHLNLYRPIISFLNEKCNYPSKEIIPFT